MQRQAVSWRPAAPSRVLKTVLCNNILSALVLLQARQQFEQAGGVVMEHTAVQGATVHPDGVAMRLPAPQRGNGASEQVLHYVDAANCQAHIVTAVCRCTCISTVHRG